MTLPPYALLPNRSVGLGPYVQRDGRLHTFCIDGDIKKINSFLDQMFAEPSGGAVAYEALTHKLFVSFAYFPSVRADNPIDRDRGVVPEGDGALWALAKVKGSILDMRWIPLFLFVDAGSAMSTGREVYGFPKQMGRFEMPTGAPPSDGPFRVSAMVMDPYAYDTVSTWKPIFSFEKERDGGLIDRIENFGEALLGRLGDSLHGITPEALQKALGGRSLLFDLPVTMAFLKQFPSAADQTRACFQSIVEADARTLKVHDAGWTATHYKGQVFSYDSHPFAETLGVPEGEMSVGHALYARFDFEMELGKDVWIANGGA
ncbi:MAG: hypothetical protein AAGC57_01780 [Pseudomonadota bacterium]